MPPKRRTRNARSRACSENTDGGDKPPPKKPRRKTKEDGTIWVDDDNISTEEDVPKQDAKFKKPRIRKNTAESILRWVDEKKPTLTLQLEDSDDDDDDDSDYVPEDEDEDEDDDASEGDEGFIQYLIEKYVSGDYEEPGSPKVFPQAKPKGKKKEEEIPIKLSRVEQTYYNSQTGHRKRELLELMKRVSQHNLDEGDIPFKFRVLELPISEYVKSSVIKKLAMLNELSEGSGEGHKLRNWIDAFMRIPFGKTVPLPVTLTDGKDKCTQFMVNARKQMDKHIYGMEGAKLQIMQIMAQWIVNPSSVGNVIALRGDMGVGKTSFARNAIAEVLQRPFEFFTLGGASDIANFIGHSYTYEGSLWGRIADSLMHAKTMNPVMYFDELDKISTTPQGEEIVSMMIHMTDRSQNSQFHDRYFAGVDFDLSQCLFVFSFNDIDKVHPILRDRMNIIHCGGYNEKDKTCILKDYIFPEILDRLCFKKDEVVISEQAINYLITEFSSQEKGVRTLIRSVESMMTRLNMLRIANHDSMKDYKFYMDVKFPLTITEEVVKTILCDYNKKEPETWRNLYT